MATCIDTMHATILYQADVPTAHLATHDITIIANLTITAALLPFELRFVMTVLDHPPTQLTGNGVFLDEAADIGEWGARG